MAYVEVRTTLPGHRKVAAASRRMGIPRPAVIGHLVCFWAWALENVDSSGSLAGVEAMDIAHAAGWPAKQRRTAERFVRDLVETGWISEEDGELFIHDWADYAGRLLTKREADAARKRAERAASRSASARVQRTSSGHKAEPETPVQRTSAGPRARVVAPHRTTPNQETPPTPSATPKPKRRSRAAAESLSFDPDERPDLQALVDRGWRVSQAQAEDLAEIANNERPSEHDVRGGFEVIAGWIREAPKRGDLHRYVLDRENQLKAERLAAADEREADWSDAKAGAGSLATSIAERLSMPNGSNGHGSRLSREQLVEQFRTYRGEVADELLEPQLARHGLTLADLDVEEVDFGSGEASGHE
jgi:hypothetical protein